MQRNIFEFTKPKYKITKPIRLIELFAGIGSQAKALQNLKIDFEHYKVIEFDEYAIKSYNAVHNTYFTPLDITKIDAEDLAIVETNKYDYILTYSFPCQDLSLAGKGAGMVKGDNTRSGLLWEVERLLHETKELPQVLLMENVPQVISQKHLPNFLKWTKELEKLGYSNYFENLNAKHYEIPQNRNRTFMISILGDYHYVFPKKKKLKLRLKDMLEDEVDEKYYLSERALKGVLATNYETSKLENRIAKDGVMPTLCARDYKDPKLVLVGELFGEKWDKVFESARRVYSVDGVSPTLHTAQGGNTEIKIAVNSHIKIQEKTKKGYAIATSGDGIYINRPHQKGGVVQKGAVPTIKTSGNDLGVVVKDTRNLKEKLADNLIGQGVVKGGEIINHSYAASRLNKDRNPIESTDGVMPTLTTRPDTLGVVTNPPLSIRKLTPKEYWRLMGFGDDDFEKASKVNSNSQLYKQAGNSIVINALEAIFKELI